MPIVSKTPPLEIRLRVLTAVDYADGNTLRARIKSVSEQTFTDQQTGLNYQFTWRTVSTWLYRYKKMALPLWTQRLGQTKTLTGK